VGKTVCSGTSPRKSRVEKKITTGEGRKGEELFKSHGVDEEHLLPFQRTHKYNGGGWSNGVSPVRTRRRQEGGGGGRAGSDYKNLSSNGRKKHVCKGGKKKRHE